MAVDQSFMIQKIMKQDVLYAAFCMNTKMPFIICDPETYNDQVWVFDSEEVLKKFIAEYAEKKYMIRGAKFEQKQAPAFFASLYTLDVNEVVYGQDGSLVKIPLESLVKRPDFSKLPVIQRPIQNPALQLSGLYFMQEATRQIPNEEKNLQDLNEEFSANLASARYIIGVLPKEGPGSIQEKLQKHEFSVPVLNLKNGKKFVPCFSDQFEFDKFRRNSKGILEMAVPLPGLRAYAGKDTDGFMLNPMGMSMALTPELLDALTKAFPERVQQGVENAQQIVKEAQEQMQKVRAAAAKKKTEGKKAEEKKAEIPVSHMPGHSKVLTPFAKNAVPEEKTAPAPVYKPVKQNEEPKEVDRKD